MDHVSLSDDLRKQLLESAAWGKIGISPKPLTEEKEVEKEESVEETKEEVKEEEPVTEEAHVCPLCSSNLEEEIDEERMLEHLDVVVGLIDRLSQLNEGDEEDIDSLIDKALDELLLRDVDTEE